MLVLSRREGESLVIGDDIIVTIERINGKRVSVSVRAPDEVNIVRGELMQMKGESDVKNR
jgi:carbon storage regulator